MLRKRLGDLLVEGGVISPAQLHQALRIHKSSGRRLGQVLIELGFVKEEDVLVRLEMQLGMPRVNPENITIADDVIGLLPKDLMQRYQSVPLSRRGQRLAVAMTDPSDLAAIDQMRKLTGLEIDALLLARSDFEAVMTLFRETVVAVKQRVVERPPVHEQPSFPEQRHELKLGDHQPEWMSGLLNKERPEQNDTLDGIVIDDQVAIRYVERFLEEAVRRNASDIHIEPYENKVVIRYRVDGILRKSVELGAEMGPPVIARIKVLSDMDIAEKRLPQDGRLQADVDGKPIEMRVSSLPTIHGEKIVARLIDKTGLLRPLDQLDFSNTNLVRFRKMVAQRHGLILITGPTGSGKSTTLYSTLQAMNTSEVNIASLEDPVEIDVEGVNQVQVQAKIGMDFANGLRALLRQDPNIIMVGEIRDGETAEIAIRAAQTGHQVISTLHTNDAPSTINRLLDMGVAPYMVASSLVGIVAQRLVRRVCQKCKRQFPLLTGEPEAIMADHFGLHDGSTWVGAGCHVCNKTGYKGRIPIHEVLTMSGSLREMIMERASAEQLAAAARHEGMIPLLDDGIEKAQAGITSLSELVRAIYAVDS